MKTHQDISELKADIKAAKLAGKRIAFVPTMGNLHEGHLSLVTSAKAHADIVVASIFVNPKQFGPNEDFASYPRTLDADCQKLKQNNTDILFLPSTETLYPEGADVVTQVSVPKLSQPHCGAHRPGHFTGVATVVAKLFNIVEPDYAMFGEKDFQQVAVIKKMVKDLNMPLEVISHPTVREADGLALSSRNGYLTPKEREIAPHLYATLEKLKDDYQTIADANLRQLEKTASSLLEEKSFKPEYLTICKADSLEVATGHSDNLVVLVAAYLGNTRLIDNLRLSV